VDKDKVNGCDIIGRKLLVTTTRKMTALSHHYVKIVRDLTGTVNKDPMWSHKPEELLFLGASGQFRSPTEGWAVTYQFLCGKTLTGDQAKITPEIALTEIRGHDYVWFIYGEETDQDRLVQRPLAAYVERVYDLGDFLRMNL
jgi:hypothetical protein